MKIVALVPALRGSECMPVKCIRPLAGKPLLYWACKAASDAGFIDTVYVGTDDTQIAETVAGLGLPEVISIDLAPEPAGDAAAEFALLDFAERVAFDALVIVQATSPLLRTGDLEAGWVRYQRGDVDSVLSAAPLKRVLWRATEEGLATPIDDAPPHHDGFLVESDAFYMTSRTALLESRCRISGRIAYAEMPSHSCLDMNDEEDWGMAEALLARRMRQTDGALADRLRKVRLVATDVDGCLTDGGMYYTERGGQVKRFNAHDGMAFAMLRNAGLLTGIITQDDTPMAARRAAKLKVNEVHQGVMDKVAMMEDILARQGLSWKDVAYLGDDINDAGVLERVGVGACPANATTAVRAVAEIRLNKPGGAGAFRELAELILAQREG